MTQERKFARALTGIGEAARVRETASQAVRESAQMAKAKSVEPIDYETFLVKSKSIIYNDPQRDLIVFPVDDLVEMVVPRKFRTSQCNVPDTATLAVHDGANLLAYESMRTYTRDWKVVSSKYKEYSSSYRHLPRLAKPAELTEHTFEIDQEDKEEEPRNPSAITKKGWLNKGPINRQDSIGFSFTKAYKKRFFCLKKQQDSTYILELFKDEKQEEHKGQIFLDSAVDVVANSKKGRYAFEIRMQDQAVHLLSTETEADMQDWIKTLKLVISMDMQDSVSQKSLSLRGGEGDDTSSLNGREGESVDSAHTCSHPEILVYAKETASTLATKRKENRLNLFEVFPSLPRPIGADEVTSPGGSEMLSEPFEVGSGSRLLLSVKELKLKLQANIADDGKSEQLSNPEPFFLTFALYDAKEGRKISENAYLDCNAADVWAMLPPPHAQSVQPSRASNPVDTSHAKCVGDTWSNPPVQVVFSARKDFSDIYLVIVVDKVLQGSMSTAVEPYLKGADVKLGTKVHRQMKQFCATIGHHRMPFAWAARPLLYPNGKFDGLSDMVLYKQEPNRLSEDDLIKRLLDLPRIDKAGKWQQIPAEFGVKVDIMKHGDVLTNLLTSSLEFVTSSATARTQSSDVAVMPACLPSLSACTVEADEFPAKAADVIAPFTAFKNHLYVYPKNLRWDGIKNVKARNIACCIQLMESDDENAVPIKCVYARPRTGNSVFVTSAFCTVVHHTTNPDYYDEVKIRLPVQVTEQHHLLFTFYHVSCEGSVKSLNKVTTSLSMSSSVRSKSPSPADAVIGYSWLHLMKQKRIVDGDLPLAVSSNLPPGYLACGIACESMGIGKSSGPEIKWQDGGKPLFKISVRLHSTIYTCDQHLTGFFQHYQKFVQLGAGQMNEIESKNALKSLHAVELGTVIQFLPTLLNQLFRLLTQTSTRDVALNIVRVIVHIVHEVSKAGKSNLLHSYVKYVFDAGYLCQKSRSVHEDLLLELSGLLRPNNADSIVVGKFLQYSWFFLEVIIKSMTQHLLSTGRIKMARTERFPSSRDSNVVPQVEGFMQMVMPHIFSKYRDAPEESREANKSVAEFLKNLFTLIDRGLVFKLINAYIANFGFGDSKTLQEYKFEFLKTVCSHEHYVQLNLPTLRSGSKDFKTEYTLCEEYKKKHFLAGLLLQELKCALNEVSDIRRIAITTFRDVIAKHALDDRYKAKAKMGRVVALYLPFLAIVLENASRLVPKDVSRPLSTYGMADNLDSISAIVPNDSRVPPSRAGNRVSVADSQASTALVVAAGSTAGNAGPSKESVVLAAIAGHVVLPSTPISASMSLRSSTAAASTDGRSSPNGSVCSDDSTVTFDAKDDRLYTRSPSALPPSTVRYAKLETAEVKDLLLCFLFIVSHLPDDILTQWISSLPESDVLDFFELLKSCLNTFQYAGKKKLSALSALYVSNSKASTLPSRRTEVIQKQLKHMSAYGDARVDATGGGPITSGHIGRDISGGSLMDEQSGDQSPQLVLLEGCLVTETGMVVLDVLSLYTISFKAHLDANDGDNHLMAYVFDLHLQFLQLSQSEYVMKQAFALIRLYISKFSYALFGGSTAGAAAAVSRCGQLCLHLLRCCSTRLASLRIEACVTLYHLMKANYEFTKRKNFARVTLQLIVSLSQLVGDMAGLANARFYESLATLNTYSLSDKSVQRTSFVGDVKKLTKRLRTVLMAMAQLKEHENDSEMLIDLHYSLARSYTNSSPQLRQTWLETMARRHVDCGNYTEAAHCYLHIAGLVAEFLKRKDIFSEGCVMLGSLSRNITGDEKDVIPVDDSGIDDTQYTEDTLVYVLEEAAQMLFKAERYEALGSLARLLIPIYERRRDYQSLSDCYHTLHLAYSKVIDVIRTGRRLLGTYFRVAFYGPLFDDEHDKQYIYKEPKLTTLSEICDRLKAIYSEKYGSANVRLIQDSKKVNPADLDPQIAYCQVTFVVPYFDEDEKPHRETDFERNEHVQRFVFHTPFTLSGRAHGAVHEQCRRNTVLTTSHYFPYVKKRIAVVKLEESDLSPIEVAVDEMRSKVTELESLIGSGGGSGYAPTRPVDIVKLQLKLQGAVNAQVNAGPLAYAEAFLVEEGASPLRAGGTRASAAAQPSTAAKTTSAAKERGKVHVEALKQAFRDFVRVCHSALDFHSTIVAPEQLDYHDAMKTNFLSMLERLSAIFGEKLLASDGQHDAGSRLSVGLTYSPSVSSA